MTNPDVPTSATGVAARLATRVPSDVIAMLAFLVVVNLAVAVVGVESPPLRVALGAPLLLFLPGYVLITTLFPRAVVPEDQQRAGGWSVVPAQYSEINGAERAALSFGLSLAVLPLFGIAVAFSPWPYAVDVVVPGLSLFVLVGAAASAARRGAVDPDSRFEVPFRAEERDLTVGVENNEQVESEYTIVTQVERVETNASGGGVTVLETSELRRTSMTLDPGEQQYDDHAVAPETTGEDLRLSYYLYKGDAPETADADSAYRHVYLWIDVSDETVSNSSTPTLAA